MPALFILSPSPVPHLPIIQYRHVQEMGRFCARHSPMRESAVFPSRRCRSLVGVTIAKGFSAVSIQYLEAGPFLFGWLFCPYQSCTVSFMPLSESWLISNAKAGGSWSFRRSRLSSARATACPADFQSTLPRYSYISPRGRPFFILERLWRASRLPVSDKEPRPGTFPQPLKEKEKR